MEKNKSSLAAFITMALVLFATLPAFSYDVYEDFMPMDINEADTFQNNAIDIAQRSDVSDELRRNIRNEIYGTDTRSEGALDDAIKKALDKEMRRIAHEETEKAVKRAWKSYPFPGAFEVGGFFGGVVRSNDPYTGGSSDVLKFAGVMNYFFSQNLAISFKGEGDFSISENYQFYAAEAGPLFAFALDSQKITSFYAAIYLGYTVNSDLSDKYGIRYANEIGLKFSVARGVNVNFGVMVAFDNNKFKAAGFETVINPMIGITAWL